MAAPVELFCARCGKPFTVPFWMIKKGRKLCSAECKKQDPLKTLLERVRIEENGCWTYMGYVGTNGYGQIKAGGKRDLAHIMMWEVWNGQEVPAGLVVRHTCIKNPACINPDHLIIGTPKQNVHDSIDQGTFVITRGEERPTAKLTEEDVKKIRALRGPSQSTLECGYRFDDIGKMFNVSAALIWLVVKRKQWAHVK